MGCAIVIIINMKMQLIPYLSNYYEKRKYGLITFCYLYFVIAVLPLSGCTGFTSTWQPTFSNKSIN